MKEFTDNTVNIYAHVRYLKEKLEGMYLDSILLAEVDDRADAVFLHEKVDIIVNDAWFSNRKSDIKESKRVLKMQQRLLSLSALRSTYYEVKTQACMETLFQNNCFSQASIGQTLANDQDQLFLLFCLTML